MSISCVVQEREAVRAMDFLHADLFSDLDVSVEDKSDIEQILRSEK